MSAPAETPSARKRAQRRQPLLEGQAERRVDDEQADEKGEEAESREIEMETVGQPRQLAFILGLDDAQRIARELRKRRGVDGRLIRRR